VELFGRGEIPMLTTSLHRQVGQKIIVALDFSSEKEAMHFLDKFDPSGPLCFVKVGMELFYSAGPSIISQIRQRNLEIFLDLKLHDIPNTVERAVAVLAQLDVSIINVHSLGGRPMMLGARRALKEAKEKNKKLRLIGVTHLTSTSSEILRQDLNIQSEIQSDVVRLAGLVKDAGLDGVVCSSLEVSKLRAKFGQDFLLVTPGVRLDVDKSGDQKRVATPAEAIKWGADYLVVGREVTTAHDPVAMFEKILMSIK